MSKSKFARRTCTAAMASAFVIGLASCSGATNTYGNLNKNDVYATAGSSDFNITVGELWDELQWSSKDVLDNQINVVILQKYINNLTNVMDNDYSALSDDDKEDLGISTEEEYKDLYSTYSDRLVDYVVQDVYNFSFSMEDYYEDYESLDESNQRTLEEKYIDEMYTTYQVDKVGEKELAELVAVTANNIDIEDNYDNYLSVATDDVLRQVYYFNYAKELMALALKTEEVEEANEDDDDEDDDMWGYFSTSEYITQFKSEYTDLQKVDTVLIKFTSTEEFENTLRAFGLKFYNKRLYYIADNMGYTYDEYIDYYDNLSTTQYTPDYDVYTVDNDAVLEIYTLIYNYVYGGYRTKFVTGNGPYKVDGKEVTELGLDKLRFLTNEVIEDYSSDATTKYNTAVAALSDTTYTAEDADTRTMYSPDELNDIGNSLKTLIYSTLDHETASDRYSTSTTSVNGGYYIAFKFGEEKLNAEDNGDDYETLQKHLDFYSSDLSDYEILSYITENNLKDYLERNLIEERITDSVISDYLSEELDDVKVKIYNEACEIAYLTANSDYSKTLKSSSDNNVLATIKYDGTTYKLLISGEGITDSKAIKIPGTDTVFGVYDYLEQTSGSTTAVDLLSKKIIKTTQAYKDTNKDRSDYEDYIEAILYSFSNGSYASSGYDSSIGKYNFLMLYFHTSKISEIIDNYYRVNYASVNLLTDYSSDDLVSFFKTYSDLAYENYFSLSGTRLVVYFDGNDDGEADDVEDWYDVTITDTNSEFYGKTRAEVAKSMVYDIYKLVAASTSSHTDRISALVTEIQGSAKAEFETNPIVAENRWAKYLHLGFNVKTEDVSATNSTVDIDFNIKQRIYDYARGYSLADDGVTKTKIYQYFINETTPTSYMEVLTDSSVDTDANNTDIVKSDDGYNLLVITSGTTKASAEWTEDDHDENILENIYFKYNDGDVVIDNIYNSEDQLNENQIKLYIIDYALNGSSTLAPSSLSDAYTAFLADAVSRFTGSETQRIILLSFIRNRAGLDSSTALYDVIKFANEDYNGADGAFAKIIEINQRIADNYNDIYDDITGTSDPYTYVDDNGNTVDWWAKIAQIVDEFLLNDDEKESE
ncbi:MAG: hypothetical protein K6A63_02855 [Acholeplasmatales bacterium]|nr:hypothetical protein [Acholeplasmatales bacterium]